MVERVIGKIPAEARVVDVGCGMNELLVRLQRDRACTGLAVDLSPEAVNYIHGSLKMPVVHGTLHDAKLAADTFDLVTMNQFLEHELDPRAILTEARRISKKGAHIVVEVPYSAGIPARLFGTYWSQRDVPRHLAFYTPDTLRDLLARCGYEVIHAEPFGVPFSAGISVLQALGFTKLGRLRPLDMLMIMLVGVPLLPFFPFLREFMLVVARAK
jgi:SAM-dependent methyltransferase